MLTNLLIMNFNRTHILSTFIALVFFLSCSPAYFDQVSKYDVLTSNKIRYSKVRRLDMSKQQLKELPSDLKKFENLRSVNLSNNPDLNFENAIQTLRELKKLEVVILDSNRIEKIPENIGSIKLLTHLSLVNNPKLDLSQLSEILQESTRLKSLNLSNNNIQKLPESFSELSTITNLRLTNNGINSVDDFIVLGKMESLDLLWLDENNIEELPISIGQLKVREIYLDNNAISYLPQEILGCSNLCVMHLGNNKFTKLPKVIIEMPKLYFVSLNKNEISLIPTVFEKSKYHLSALVLDDNELSEDQIKMAKKYFSSFFLLSL